MALEAGETEGQEGIMVERSWQEQEHGMVGLLCFFTSWPLFVLRGLVR